MAKTATPKASTIAVVRNGRLSRESAKKHPGGKGREPIAKRCYVVTFRNGEPRYQRVSCKGSYNLAIY